MKVFVTGLGIWSPWFANHTEFTAVMQSDQLPEASSTTPKPELIPKNERRRAPLCVRLAVEVASQAVADAGLDASGLATVFACGLGDTAITANLCRALCTPEQLISPTKFHNSVHNAAAGYWTISTRCMETANAVSAFDKTVPVALLEAASQVEVEQRPVLLVMYDDAPEPILRMPFNCDAPFAAALVLAPEPSQATNPALELHTTHMEAQAGWPTWPEKRLSALYNNNPAARVLPLLQAIAPVLGPPDVSELTMPLSSTVSLSINISN